MEAVDTHQLIQTASDLALRVGLQIVGALVVFIVGRRLIDLGVHILGRSLARQSVDPTVQRYVGNFVSAAANIALVIAILGYFGLETTTFAAMLAAAGIAIGMAWSGLLSNFAAGAFLVVLRPFKVGDFVQAGGVTGTVTEIGLFATVITTPDNVVAILGNGKIFGDTIQNFSANRHRRVDLEIQLHHGADFQAVRQLILDRLAKIPNVLDDPAPQVELLEANMSGPLFAVRPSCHMDHYWQVWFDAQREIYEACSAAGYPAPDQHFTIKEAPPRS